MIVEYGGIFVLGDGVCQQFGEVCVEEYVVVQYECDMVVVDEVCVDSECLCEVVGVGLFGIGYGQFEC